MITTKQLQETAQKHVNVNIRKELADLISTINPVEMVTPTNLAKVKKDWIEKAKQGFFENPIFVYDQGILSEVASKAGDLAEMRGEIVNIIPTTEGEGFLYRHYLRVIDDAVASVRMAQAMLAQDDIALANNAVAKYGRPKTMRYAENMAKNGYKRTSITKPILPQEQIQLLKEATLDANFIKEIFVWSMAQYGASWPVELLEDCSAIDVRDKNSSGKPMIAIPADRKVNGIKLAELVGHEIECHWRGSQNNEIIGCLKSDDEVVYEGVAKLKDMAFQESVGGEVAMPAPYHVLAEDLALCGLGFAEISQFVYGYTGSEQKAWTFAYRALRGVANTSNPAGYALTKDRAYLEGMLYAQRVQENNTELLNFSALSIADLEDLARLIDIGSIAEVALTDKNIQDQVLAEIIKRL